MSFLKNNCTKIVYFSLGLNVLFIGLILFYFSGKTKEHYQNIDYSKDRMMTIATLNHKPNEILFLGDSHINTNSTMQNVTLTHSNWMGVSALYTEGFSMKAVKITGMNQFDEFTLSIQSGGL